MPDRITRRVIESHPRPTGISGDDVRQTVAGHSGKEKQIPSLFAESKSSVYPTQLVHGCSISMRRVDLIQGGTLKTNDARSRWGEGLAARATCGVRTQEASGGLS